MFRIRRIYDEILPLNKDTLLQVKTILRSRFSDVLEQEIEEIGSRLHNPFKQRFRTILFVAENSRHRVLGFAVLLHEPQIGFCYLDWIATASGRAWKQRPAITLLTPRSRSSTGAKLKSTPTARSSAAISQPLCSARRRARLRSSS